jgi:hypothetical protein
MDYCKCFFYFKANAPEKSPVIKEDAMDIQMQPLECQNKFHASVSPAVLSPKIPQDRNRHSGKVIPIHPQMLQAKKTTDILSPVRAVEEKCRIDHTKRQAQRQYKHFPAESTSSPASGTVLYFNQVL